VHVEIAIKQPQLGPQEVAILARGNSYIVGPNNAESVCGLSDDELLEAAHLMNASRSTWEDQYVPTLRTFEHYCKEVLGVPVTIR